MSGPRSFRRSERFLLAPPLAALFRAMPVAICDLSLEGVRFRHEMPLQTGMKSVLLIASEGDGPPIALETMIVWTQPDTLSPGSHMSGGRTWAESGTTAFLIERLRAEQRTTLIEELRSTERFAIQPKLTGTFAGQPVAVENLSARGAGLELRDEPQPGATATLALSRAEAGVDLAIPATVRWSALKAIEGAARTWRAGLQIDERPELLRLVIGHLCEQNRATLDAHSLRLKLKVLQARARQLAGTCTEAVGLGIPAEQYLLIQGVREELRLNTNAALHWYRRARLVIADPRTRAIAPSIAGHPDAVAVWEYLDRSIDPSIVGLAFQLRSR